MSSEALLDEAQLADPRMGPLPLAHEAGDDADDPAALAAALAPLLADPALREACGRRARARFEAGFTLSAMLDKTLAVYRQALDGQVPPDAGHLLSMWPA